MPVTKTVNYMFKCAHCGAEKGALSEELPHDERVHISDAFPEGWVGGHVQVSFNKLVHADKNSEDDSKYDRQKIHSDKVFCSMKCAIDHTTYELDQLREDAK